MRKKPANKVAKIALSKLDKAGHHAELTISAVGKTVVKR